MRLHRVWLWGWLAAAGVGACTSDVLDLEGKQCDSRRACAAGYVCDERDNRCVRPAELSADDAGLGLGGTLAASGAGGSGFAGVSNGGAAGVTAGSGGSAPGAVGGSVSAGGGDAGSGTPPPVPDGGCAGRIYRDADGDSVGNALDFIEGACPELGWVSQPGDCRDDLATVFPGQIEFFLLPFVEELAPGGISFDYDCSGTEEPAPGTNLAALPDCSGLGGVLACPTGSGFVPFSPPRSGDNIDPRCGSNLRRACVGPALSCAAEDIAVADQAAFRCK